MPDYRQLERPLPEEEGHDSPGQDRPESPPRPEEGPEPDSADEPGQPVDNDSSTQSDRQATEAWQKSLPGLQDLWRKHEEKWPSSERPLIDRSHDEPGSWRGDSGLLLNSSENKLVDEAYDRVAAGEKQITERMEQVEAASAGQLAGRGFSLKERDSFKDKVASAHDSAPEASLNRIASNIRDVVRYTLQYSESSYSNGVRADIAALRDRGCEIVKLKNFWGDDEYKGINSQWRENNTGQTFEVQFHTRVSFEAKQLTHGAYEGIRSMPAANDTKFREKLGEMHSYQRLVCEYVPTPADALTILDYPH